MPRAAWLAARAARAWRGGGGAHGARPPPPVPQGTVQAFFPNARCNFHAAKADPVVQELLSELASRQARYRRPGTWTTYLGPWRNAWAWIEPKLRVEMQLETGCIARPTVEDLVEHAHIAHAYAQLRSRTNKIGAVKATCTAINFAMSLHEQPDIMNAFPMRMLREVMRRDLGTHVKKMHELRRGETIDIINRWGFESDCPWRRQVALMMALGRALLLRSAGLFLLQVRGIFFLPDGALLCVARRKNVHHGKFAWLPLSDSFKERSTVALLRLHLAGLGYDVPPPHARGDTDGARRVGVGKVGDNRGFLFRPMQRRKGYTHAHKTEYTLQGGALSMAVCKTTGYNATLKLMRRALTECCGYSAKRCKAFGTHSCRRGGDTALFDAGVSQEKRQLLGMWKTAEVELTYIGFDATQHLRWARATAV